MNPCAVEGCTDPRFRREWCCRHYNNWRRKGAVNAPTINRIELEDVEWMAETGESFEGAAMRLGVQASSLERFLDREKRRDLMAAFRRLVAVA